MADELTRSCPPGVAELVWTAADGLTERWLLADLAVAPPSWLPRADVVICPPQPTVPAARMHVRRTLRALPGCTVIAVRSERRWVVLVRNGRT